jgi:hypothetical protein
MVAAPDQRHETLVRLQAKQRRTTVETGDAGVL